LNFLGDLSAKGLSQAHGLMVNYLYKLDDIEINHERFAAKNEVVAADRVRKLLRADPAPRESTPKNPTPPKGKSPSTKKTAQVVGD
jgi:malonyl-CoA decarboxylase